MDKKYNHIEIEKDKDLKWKEKKYFSSHDLNKEPYSILLPPPNVTGKLHLGHAWDTAIQDTLIRYNKLQGKDVMWIPGMDHAGIATQAKVEARLREEGISRYDLGREKFIEKVWEWKEEYASTIRTQWSKLGLALDYPNEKFTLDKNLSDAVQKVFIDLYKRKLIYRGTRPVNWDPQLQTVLSNIEVEAKETEQIMYYINYDLKDGGSVAIATVRTETLYSDVAIAVNPSDDKMKHLIGKIAIHPLTNKELPIIADKEIEIGKGTGAMKVSAHAEPDFAILKSNNLPIVECIDKQGIMNNNAMNLEGMDRFKARLEVVKLLGNRVYKQEKTISAVGHSERSGAVVEVLIQPQWFVNMEPLAKKILKNINSKEGVEFKPLRFENTLKKWMEEIQDWCISRQLWWGHRIPAWYKDDEIKVQVECPGEGWIQDEDVLDTWFSSGIAPFTFLGWPDKTKELKRFYPSATLVTGYDIIFFWVARMYFQSLDIMNEAPFKEILIHGLIRAEDGRKMSKSLGNGIDPMEVVDKYGSDSLRWFLLTNSTPGQDIRYSTTKLEAAWNLNNKLWNISRYILEIMPEGNNQISEADKWIESKFASLLKIVEAKMKDYEFTIIGKEINKFIMEDFSSWYVEMSKENPNQKFAKELLGKLMIVLHPFMPFISDHIFNLINNKELLESEWPSAKFTKADEIDRAIEIIKLFREFRVKYSLSNKEILEYSISETLSNLEISVIEKMANASQVDNKDTLIPFGNIKIYIKLSSEAKEKQEQAISKQIQTLKAEIKRAEGMLSNERFTSKAPAEKIKLEKDKLIKFKQELSALEKNN